MVPDEPGFSLEVHPLEGGGTRVVAAGELDVAVAEQFRQTVAEQLAAGRVLLDLRGLEFMDSSGIRALDTLLRVCAEEGRVLHVCAEVQPPVRQLLEMTGMLELLALADAEEAG